MELFLAYSLVFGDLGEQIIYWYDPKVSRFTNLMYVFYPVVEDGRKHPLSCQLVLHSLLEMKCTY